MTRNATMQFRPLPALIALLFLARPLPTNATDISEIEGRYNQLSALKHDRTLHPDTSRAARVEQRYLQLFASLATAEQLQAIASRDLGFILRAAEEASFYSANPAYLHDMRTVLAELEGRGDATDLQRSSLYRATIAMRDFEAAQAILLQHPSLPVDPLPTVIRDTGTDTASPTVYRITSRPATLREIRLEITNGTHLIVIAHPLCAFSHRAMQALQADPLLAPLLAQHATWLAPVDGRLYLDVLDQWNRENPSTPILLTKHHADWPMLDDWATPNFYLLHNGQVLGRVTGWPKEGNREALLELLAAGGLIDPPR